MERGLSEGSLPAYPDAVFIVEARGRECSSFIEQQRYRYKFSRSVYELLAPVG